MTCLQSALPIMMYAVLLLSPLSLFHRKPSDIALQPTSPGCHSNFAAIAECPAQPQLWYMPRARARVRAHMHNYMHAMDA